MNRRFFLIFLVLIGSFFAYQWLTPALRYNSEEVRAAMDIGSGATNLQVARVNPANGKIVAVLFQKSIPVPYQKHLEQSSDNRFDDAVMNQGIAALQLLKENAQKYQIKKIIAVATAAFRQASNAQQFTAKVLEETGIEVRIISQDEEGILSFRGALAISRVNPQQAIVWDIGGGSMQLTALSPTGTYLVAKGPTASIPFKNAMIQQIEGKDLKSIASPNPISSEHAEAGVQFAEKLASKTDDFIQEKIKEPKTQVLAVGSLFNYGIKPLVPTPLKMHQADLEKGITALINKSDAELTGGALSEVAVSNPILVLGFMKGLGINQLEILQVNNTDGVLTYAPYWIK